jgi:O-antigen/teichoic acid export membrane protein
LRATVRLGAVGALVLAFFLPAAHLALTRFYGLPSPIGLLLMGGASVWPIFFYLPIIYALFRAERQGLVILVNAGGIGVSVALNLALLPSLGLMGAAAGAAAAQWAMGLAYALAAGPGRRLWWSHAAAVPELPRDA